jgi:hypothetical protein
MLYDPVDYGDGAHSAKTRSAFRERLRQTLSRTNGTTSHGRYRPARGRLDWTATAISDVNAAALPLLPQSVNSFANYVAANKAAERDDQMSDLVERSLARKRFHLPLWLRRLHHKGCRRVRSDELQRSNPNRSDVLSAGDARRLA